MLILAAMAFYLFITKLVLSEGFYGNINYWGNKYKALISNDSSL